MFNTDTLYYYIYTVNVVLCLQYTIISLSHQNIYSPEIVTLWLNEFRVKDHIYVVPRRMVSWLLFYATVICAINTTALDVSVPIER